MPSMIGTALALAHRSLAVFPCVPREKRPATANGCKDATTDADTIRQWWTQRTKLQRRNRYRRDVSPCSRSTSTASTPRSSCASWRQTTARCRPRSRSSPRAAGIYISGCRVRRSATRRERLPPASTCAATAVTCWCRHRCTRAARLTPGRSTAPRRLQTRPRGCWPGSPNRKGSGKQPAPASEWRALMANGVSEGQRNAVLARITGYLLRHHIDPVFAAGLVQSFNTTRCDPPLTEKEVS